MQGNSAGKFPKNGVQASIRSAGRMFAFLLLAMTLIAITNNFTFSAIQENRHNKLIDRLKSISDKNAAIAWDRIEAGKLPMVLCNHENQHLGWLSQIDARGYAGTIKILIGLNENHTITGLTILDHRETPGIGDIIEEEKSPWLQNFVHLGPKDATIAPWQVKTRGGKIDAISGATITTTAVTHAIHGALTALPWSNTKTGSSLCKS